MVPRLLWIAVLAASPLLAAVLPAEDKKAGAPADLPREAGRILKDRCAKCHGGAKPKSGLDLSDLAAAAQGGKRGPVVVPGKPDASRLWQLIQEDSMPPEDPLPAGERATLRRWIEEGAPGLKAAAKVHWAFVPPARPPVPAVRHAELVRTGVDPFILAALEAKGLTLSPEADRAALARRLSFDLLGLPPTPEEVAAFLADPAPDAYEKLVERLLASPHYGERWGKFWLDAAGYAESNGYFSADSDRPHAWRYRDYVIRSFNADKPYDRFVTEQLAGDELAGYVPGGAVTPEMVEPLVATHFLRNAPDGTGESDGNPDEVRIDRFTVLEGTLQITMNCLLGVTIQCARCHAHKFEPVGQDEYYSLQAIFYPAYCPDRWKPPKDRLVTVATPARREAHRRLTERIDQQVKALQDGLALAAAAFREQVLDERLPALDAKIRAEISKALGTPKEKRTPEQNALLAKHKAADVSDDDLAKRFPEYAALREQVRKAVAAREQERPRPLETLSVLVEADPTPPPHHVLVRGQHNQPGREVQPGVPAAFCTTTNVYRLDPRPPGRVSTGRRTAFARWVTSPENPLTARVLVNRLWQHHFGRGLVATPDNLGQSGARPSHSELLDYLATEFVRSGWSVKAMHRLIVRSAAYRQAVARRGEAFQLDPDNHLLWRYPLRRLDAEAVRDAMLAVSGELDPRPGGPYVPTRRTPEGVVEADPKHEGARRRSVYLQQRRTQVPTLLELFDAPAIASTCGARTTSTVPLQSLALLNSDFARARARGFAQRLEREAGVDAGRQVELAFRLACGRAPGDEERSAAWQFLAAQRAAYQSATDGEARAWADLCQMLLASNAFLYVD